MEQIFDIWPTTAALASDMQVPYPTAQAWKRRGSLPAHYDLDLIAAARTRGRELSLEEIARARCATQHNCATSDEGRD
jgi:hypothetical protein